MFRWIVLVCSLALLTSFGTTRDALASEAEPTAESEESEGREAWRAKLLAANREVALAEKRADAAMRSYKTMRNKRHPRGEGKQAIMEELEASKEDLAKARQDLADLEKAARRAGAPPSWMKFDPAEVNEAPQAPASPES